MEQQGCVTALPCGFRGWQLRRDRTGSTGRKPARIVGLPILVTEKDWREMQAIPDAGARASALSELNLLRTKRWLVTECRLLGISRAGEILRFIRASRTPFSFPTNAPAQARLVGVACRGGSSHGAEQGWFALGKKRQIRREARELGIEGELVRALNDNDPVVNFLVDPLSGKTIPNLAPPVGQEAGARWAKICWESQIFNALNMRPHWCKHGRHWYVAGRHGQKYCSVHSNVGRQAAWRARRRSRVNLSELCAARQRF